MLEGQASAVIFQPAAKDGWCVVRQQVDCLRNGAARLHESGIGGLSYVNHWRAGRIQPTRAVTLYCALLRNWRFNLRATDWPRYDRCT